MQIESTVTATERVSTSAVILADGSLSVTHEVAFDATPAGPRNESQMGYRVPVDREGELLNALPGSLRDFLDALRWAAADSWNAQVFRSALNGMEPTVQTSLWVG